MEAVLDASNDARLRQASTVVVDDCPVEVVSEILFEPEPMCVTRVWANGRIVKKTHVALPPATMRGDAASMAEAQKSTLHALHLRYVRALVSGTAAPQPAAATMNAGVLGTLVLGPAGEVVSRAGEEQVPGGWLRATYLLCGFGDALGTSHGLGGLRSVVVHGDGMGALVTREQRQTKILFVDPRHIPSDAASGLAGELKRHTWNR